MNKNTESQEDYLDRICSNSRRKKKKKTQKPPEDTIFGYSWSDIQSMQQGTYKHKIIS